MPCLDFRRYFRWCFAFRAEKSGAEWRSTPFGGSWALSSKANHIFLPCALANAIGTHKYTLLSHRAQQNQPHNGPRPSYSDSDSCSPYLPSASSLPTTGLSRTLSSLPQKCKSCAGTPFLGGHSGSSRRKWNSCDSPPLSTKNNEFGTNTSPPYRTFIATTPGGGN